MGNKSKPEITKCKQSKNWTGVTFKPDLEKFNMTELEKYVMALTKKRVVDMAGTLGTNVKVELNGHKVAAKTFLEYVQLYIDSASKDGVDLPRIHQKVNDRWEVCMSLSEGQFQQVSFLNGIATIRGGTHVDYVANQIASHVMKAFHKKNKNANVKPHTIKCHLWVFVNSLIDNHAFDSQTKETLTTRQGSFGSNCDLSLEFLRKVENSGIVDNLLSWADFKLKKDLKKTDGTKWSNILGIPKLDDANDAGGKESDKCTLILTEGDSAKALAMVGIGQVGRDHYGVFPLRGKLLNVREASMKQLTENAEIQNIKKLLGLQHDKNYDSTNGMRYGHLMIMTDQGLGTSTTEEGQGYFEHIGKHKKDFVWADDEDDTAIDLAFSKKMISERKNKLSNFQVAQFIGYVSEHSAYHHGEQSLASTILGMAQDFVGSNSINLLEPIGQFGNRNQGGKDSASARFVPIIPMVLVKGSEGIGTGWSSNVPNYNPRDIIANLKRLLNEEPVEPMDPWYKGFKVSIEKTIKATSVTYTITESFVPKHYIGNEEA
ncbi:hypothetical protein ACQ4PT_052450 [Festuca glaucescens]